MNPATKETSQVVANDVVYKGLRYYRSPHAFLSAQESEYALEAIWQRCGGGSDWYGEPVINFSSASRSDVDHLHALTPGTLPSLKLQEITPDNLDLRLDTDCLPAPLGVSDGPEYSADAAFPIDLVAFTFLMLTRWEELHQDLPQDEHGRVSHIGCLAYRQGFLDRPVIDEWALVLRAWLQARCPSLELRATQASLLMTHDVDNLRRFPRLWNVVRGGLGELATRSRNPLIAATELAQGWRAWRDYRCDPYLIGLENLLTLDESLGVRGCFYFMTAKPSQYDTGYDIQDKSITELIASIRKRGHEIGWHPGYRAATDDVVFKEEKQRMDQCHGSGAFGGRQHYLKWTAGRSWENWEDAGLTYDSSLGFAEAIGFRCGTCQPFPTYSLARNQCLRLIERPLLIMDSSLEFDCPAGMSPQAHMDTILQRVKTVGGEAVVLIHNSYRNKRILPAMVNALQDF